MILENNWLRQADESRGRFRSFLLKSVQNFLHHAAERKHARKRGGEVEFVAWDDWMAEAPSQFSISEQHARFARPGAAFRSSVGGDGGRTSIAAFARGVRKQTGASGFSRRSAFISRPRAERSRIAQLAATLGVAETVVKKQMHNLRERYRWLLRNEVAHTVENPDGRE